MKRILLPYALSGTLALIAPGRPVPAQTPSAADLAHRAIERRAIEAVIWGMPAVN